MTDQEMKIVKRLVIANKELVREVEKMLQSPEKPLKQTAKEKFNEQYEASLATGSWKKPRL